MTAELRVVTPADETAAITEALMVELARVAGLLDNHERQHWFHIRTSALAPLRELVRAAGITPTPPRRHR